MESVDIMVGEDTPGQLLKKKRESSGFTTAYVAEQLRLTESYIGYLEKDEFNKLPSEPFVLGYYRAYARILNMSPESIIASYRSYRQAHADELDALSEGSAVRTSGTHRQHQIHPRPIKNSRQPGLSGNKIYIIVAIALIGVWVVVSLLSDSDTDQASVGQTVEQSATKNPVDSDDSLIGNGLAGSSSNKAQTEPVVETVVETAGGAVDDVEINESPDSLTPSTLSPTSQPVEQNTNNPSATESDTDGPSAAVAASLDRLGFVFSAECWLEVIDANGDVVAANLYQNGDSVELQGVAPFKVNLGNVRAVQMRLNGVQVDVKPNGSNKTLRTTVGVAAPQSE